MKFNEICATILDLLAVREQIIKKLSSRAQGSRGWTPAWYTFLKMGSLMRTRCGGKIGGPHWKKKSKKKFCLVFWKFSDGLGRGYFAAKWKIFQNRPPIIWSSEPKSWVPGGNSKIFELSPGAIMKEEIRTVEQGREGLDSSIQCV